MEECDQKEHRHKKVNEVNTYQVPFANKEIKVDLQVYQSWVKWSNGRENQMNWHEHLELNQGISFAAVYYIKTIPFFSSGTLFKDGFVRAPQNSMIIFPAHLLHTTPTNPFPFIDRYVMSIDLNIRNSY